jgi:hypothetical protein
VKLGVYTQPDESATMENVGAQDEEVVALDEIVELDEDWLVDVEVIVELDELDLLDDVDVVVVLDLLDDVDVVVVLDLLDDVEVVVVLDLELVELVVGGQTLAVGMEIHPPANVGPFQSPTR